MRLQADLRRLGHIGAVGFRHGLAWAIGPRGRRWRWLARRLPALDLPAPERFRLLLEDLGGTFVKLGQMLALQPDIISLEYCNALFKLLDRIEPADFSDLEKTFAEELGVPPSEFFDEIDSVPLATASIGQVHLAVRDGRTFAVKVQRPHVEYQVDGDLRLMKATVFLIEKLRLRRLKWLMEPLTEFVTWTREEMDYRNEARYMERLGENARDNPFERIPEILRSCSTRRTLAVEYLEGTTVLDYLRALEAGDRLTLLRLARSGFDADRFARNIIENFLGDAFQFGLFHADLHPANLLILPNNVVGYVDFGITGVLSPYSRRQLVAMTLAYTRGDLDGMCDAFLKISSMDPDADPDGFRRGLFQAGEKWYEVDGRTRRLTKNFTHIMLDMVKLSRRAGIWPAREVIKYIRSAIAIDGLITRFAPSIDFGPALEEVCSRRLRWHVLADSLSFGNLVDSWNSSAHLARKGVVEAADFLDRLGKGEVPLRAQMREPDGAAPGHWRQRALHLAGLVFILALAMYLFEDRAAVGVNLFTAKALVAGGALVALVRTFRRLA